MLRDQKVARGEVALLEERCIRRPGKSASTHGSPAVSFASTFAFIFPFDPFHHLKIFNAQRQTSRSRHCQFDHAIDWRCSVLDAFSHHDSGPAREWPNMRGRTRMCEGTQCEGTQRAKEHVPTSSHYRYFLSNFFQNKTSGP